MAKYKRIPVVIEAITFEEFVEYGKRAKTETTIGEKLWSFKYSGHPVTQENDNRYLIKTLEGIMNLTPDDMLITGVAGEIYPCKKKIFNQIYEPAP